MITGHQQNRVTLLMPFGHQILEKGLTSELQGTVRATVTMWLQFGLLDIVSVET